MATINKVLHTDGSMVFQNSAGTNAGSWVTTTNTGAIGGSYRTSTNGSDKCTITWTGRALYLFIAQDGLGTDFSITTDGTTKSIGETCNERTITASSLGYYRVAVCIERNLADTSHVTVIQSVFTSLIDVGATVFPNLYINGYASVTGAKTIPVSNTGSVLTMCGDSWTRGSGALTLRNAYAYLTQKFLSRATSKDWTLNNLGIGGAGLVTRSSSALETAFEQAIAANTQRPNVLSFLYGVNDLSARGSSLSPSQFISYYRTLLWFLEDVYDVSKTKILVGTPGFISSFYRYQQLQASNQRPVSYNYNMGEYEQAVIMMRQFKKEFSWIYMPDIYFAMDENAFYITPSSSSDNGLHPGNAGHNLIANEFTQSILEAIKQ